MCYYQLSLLSLSLFVCLSVRGSLKFVRACKYSISQVAYIIMYSDIKVYAQQLCLKSKIHLIRTIWNRLEKSHPLQLINENWLFRQQL